MKVFLIGETVAHLDEYIDYLLGEDGWETDVDMESSEALIEVAGRRCYNSFDLKLNPNLTRTRSGNQEYLQNILKVGHGSVLEHAYVTFAIENVSRVFTHEAVRHRHLNVSQESMRFVRSNNLISYVPECFENNEEAKQIWIRAWEQAQEHQDQLVELFDMNNPTMSFSIKKQIQSSIRRLIPGGINTGIILTGNHRTWRHFLRMRGNPTHAEEEIYKIALEISEILGRSFPNIYQDMSYDLLGNICFEYPA